MTAPANSPKTPTRKPWGTIMVILVPGCCLLVVLAVAVPLAALFWPEFFRAPSPSSARVDDPMALLPAGSNWVLGADLDKLRADGTLEPMLGLLTNPPAGFPSDALPPGMADVVRDGQSLLVAGAAGDDKAKPVVILTMRGPADVEKIKRQCRVGAEQSMHGFAAYRTQIGKGEPGKKAAPGWLAFPGERVVLLSEASEQDFAALLAAARTPTAHPAAEFIGEARSAPLWAVLHFDAGMKQKLKETLAKYVGEMATALQTARGAILKIEFPEKAVSANVKLEVLYANEAEAAAMAKAAQKSLQENQLLLQGALFVMALQNHPATGLVRDMTKTLSINANGTRAVATMQLTEKTLQQFEKRQK
jgi:hypothetical protein